MPEILVAPFHPLFNYTISPTQIAINEGHFPISRLKPTCHVSVISVIIYIYIQYILYVYDNKRNIYICIDFP